MFLFKWFKNKYLATHLPFSIKCRNMWIFVNLVLWILGITTAVLGYAIRGATFDRLLARLPNAFFVLSTPIGLFRVVQSNTVSDNVALYFMYCCAIFVTLESLLVPPNRTTSQTILLLLFVLPTNNIPNWKRHSLVIVPSYLIMMYNSTFAVHNYQRASFMNELENDLMADAISHVRMFFLIPLGLGCVAAQSYAYNETVEKLQRAVGMTKRVSELLAEYNTSEAEAILKDYTETESKKGGDLALVSILSTLVENLNKYRPFLPNYVINNVIDAEGEFRECDVENVENEPASSSSLNILTSISSVSIEKHKSTPLLAMIPTRRTVSYALIDYTVVTDDVIDNPHTLRDFIDRTYRYANMTSGAIHSCVGNTLHMTWNATRPVSTPERRAVDAMLDLRILTKNVSGKGNAMVSSRINVNGSIMTGVGECRMTGTIHQAFLLDISWRHAQCILHQYSRKVNTVVVCQDTAKGTAHATIKMDSFLNTRVEAHVIVDRAVFTKFGVLVSNAVTLAETSSFDESTALLLSISEEEVGFPRTCLEKLLKKIDVCKNFHVSWNEVS
eukprot:PhF_6_TR8303/c1_g1_i8/m.12824